MTMREHAFTTPEVVLNYAAGPPNGPALLLLHGQGSVWQDWRPVIDHFKDAWQIFAPDFRGCGASGRSAAGRYALTDFADDIQRFVRSVIGTPVVIVGHSLGSMVALLLAARDDERQIRGIVLEDPPLYLSEFFQEWMWYPYYPVAREALAVHADEAHIARELAARLDLAEADAAKEARNLLRIDPRIIHQVMERIVFSGFDAEALLERVTCPLLLLHGEWERGSALRPADVARVADRLPPGRVQCIAGAGHSLHPVHCRPKAFNRAVEAFVNRLDPG